MHSACRCCARPRETHGWKCYRRALGRERSGKRIPSVNPAYDEDRGRAGRKRRGYRAAVDAGKAAFPAWSRMRVDERVKHCKQFVAAIRSAPANWNAGCDRQRQSFHRDGRRKKAPACTSSSAAWAWRSRARRSPRPVAAWITRALSRSASWGESSVQSPDLVRRRKDRARARGRQYGDPQARGPDAVVGAVDGRLVNNAFRPAS